MPLTLPACTDNHEASDLSSDHAVELFKVWLKCLPGYEWAEAHVDRFEGLTLMTRDFTTSLHFRSALCGYGGQGPQATLEILQLAGFGHRNDLENIIHTNKRYTFRR